MKKSRVFWSVTGALGIVSLGAGVAMAQPSVSVAEQPAVQATGQQHVAAGTAAATTGTETVSAQSAISAQSAVSAKSAVSPMSPQTPVSPVSAVSPQSAPSAPSAD